MHGRGSRRMTLPPMAGRRDLRLLRTTHDGYGELNKRVQRAKIKLLKLHYKDEKVFPFEKDITKLKEQFQVLEKDRHASYLGSRQVETLLRGMNTTDPGIEAAKTTIFHSMQHNFDRACEFMSAYILSEQAEAQHAYANRRHNMHMPTRCATCICQPTGCWWAASHYQRNQVRR